MSNFNVEFYRCLLIFFFFFFENRTEFISLAAGIKFAETLISSSVSFHLQEIPKDNSGTREAKVLISPRRLRFLSF